MRRLFYTLRKFDDFGSKRGLPRLLGAGSSFEIQTFPIILTDNFLSGDDCYHIAIFSEIQRNDFAINRMKSCMIMSVDFGVLSKYVLGFVSLVITLPLLNV